jgi:hypothetical protein
MSTMIKASICLPMASAMFFTVALAGPAAAAKYVPFKGSFQGGETYVFSPTSFVVEGSLKGVASHLGKFTLAYTITVSTAPATQGQGIGSARLVAANGDMLFTTLIGLGLPDPDTAGFQRIVEMHTITGGTGRFAGAQGSFTIVRLVEQATGDTSGSFDGAIISPGAGNNP